MTPELETLMARIRSAGYVLALMEETGASDAALIQQVDYLRGLRRELNAECPDGEYDPTEFNIVAEIR